MVLRIFKIALRLRDLHVFFWQSLEILNAFNDLILKQIFVHAGVLFDGAFFVCVSLMSIKYSIFGILSIKKHTMFNSIS